MIVSISILTWNNIGNMKILFESLVEDLKEFDHYFYINICDNGSNDGTKEYLDKNNVCGKNIILNKNHGIGIAKNLLIEEAMKNNSEYMFMFDNDVAIIPGSLNAMVEFMERNENVACVRQRIDNYSKDINDDKICKKFPNVEDLELVYNVKSGCGATRAWTHYAVYRNSIFGKGIGFEEGGPFGEAGYGFDDDDFGNSIVFAGYDIVCFDNIFCFHNINSSVEMLMENNKLHYKERETYFKNKWSLM